MAKTPDAKSQTPDSNVLARITGNPQLARAVPLLRPEVLHAVITHCGLHDSGELLALVTPEQLSAVFDLDLWKASRAGADEQFDAARFCEWLEVLVDANPKIAAERMASMDAALVVAGLSPNVTVFDPGVFSPDGESSGADAVMNAGRERGAHAEIGGYIVVARRPDAWEAIVDVLVALAADHSDAFHRVMRACRHLSNAGFELDGLDDLLSDAEQAPFDLSITREQRQDQLGFLPAQQARAFLHAARHALFTKAPPERPPVFIAYQRSLETKEPEASLVSAVEEQSDDAPVDDAPAVAAVIDVLRGAGVLADTSRALLPAGPDAVSPVNPAFNQYVTLRTESDDGWTTLNQELAFLANALVAGCSVQGRTFARREAMDAVAATCNLGLDHWPPEWGTSSQHDLVTVFQCGWTRLHRDVSIAAAACLLDVVDQIRSSDRELQLELHALRRELHRALQAAAPWRAPDRLDVLAILDLPAWAALTALLDECPVMLANVGAPGGQRPHRVNPSDFRFISDARDIAAIQGFLRSLPELLTH